MRTRATNRKIIIFTITNKARCWWRVKVQSVRLYALSVALQSCKRIMSLWRNADLESEMLAHGHDTYVPSDCVPVTVTVPAQHHVHVHITGGPIGCDFLHNEWDHEFEAVVHFQTFFEGGHKMAPILAQNVRPEMPRTTRAWAHQQACAGVSDNDHDYNGNHLGVLCIVCGWVIEFIQALP